MFRFHLSLWWHYPPNEVLQWLNAVDLRVDLDPGRLLTNMLVIPKSSPTLISACFFLKSKLKYLYTIFNTLTTLVIYKTIKAHFQLATQLDVQVSNQGWKPLLRWLYCVTDLCITDDCKFVLKKETSNNFCFCAYLCLKQNQLDLWWLTLQPLLAQVTKAASPKRLRAKRRTRQRSSKGCCISQPGAPWRHGQTSVK